MTTIGRRIFLASAFSLLATTAACDDADAPTKTSSGDYSVQLWNDSPIAITAVSFTVAEGVEIRQGVLGPGARTGVHEVSAVHSTPALSLMAAGKHVALIPVEGFAGFNPVLPKGRYLYRIQVSKNGELVSYGVVE